MRKFKGIRTGSVYTEIFSDEKGILLEVEGFRVFHSNEWVRDHLKEIKEPVKITIWKNVWQREDDGSYFFGCDWPDEQSAKRDANDICRALKHIKTVKFEEEIKQ